ncbi:hypothetical protein E8E14_014677 [Neopestalotiopsis sp. 37M]|nr:hypothetical protein E8E14_014677 [Neopestalotiopsis sp. 37M]
MKCRRDNFAVVETPLPPCDLDRSHSKTSSARCAKPQAEEEHNIFKAALGEFSWTKVADFAKADGRGTYEFDPGQRDQVDLTDLSGTTQKKLRDAIKYNAEGIHISPKQDVLKADITKVIEADASAQRTVKVRQDDTAPTGKPRLPELWKAMNGKRQEGERIAIEATARGTTIPDTPSNMLVLALLRSMKASSRDGRGYSNCAPGKNDHKPLVVEKSHYRRRLEDLRKRFVVLHDVESRKAWLADGLSVLLHLVRANLDHAHSNIYEDSLIVQSDLKEIEGIRGRAFETLTNRENISLLARLKFDEGSNAEESDLSIRIIDISKDMMQVLELMLDQQADDKKSYNN